MITDTDIIKMKKVFITKDYIKKLSVDIKDLKTDVRSLKSDVKDVKIDVKDLKIELRNSVDQLTEVITERTSVILERLDANHKELKGQRVQIGDHEDRLQKVETKVFPSTSSG